MRFGEVYAALFGLLAVVAFLAYVYGLALNNHGDRINALEAQANHAAP